MVSKSTSKTWNRSLDLTLKVQIFTNESENVGDVISRLTNTRAKQVFLSTVKTSWVWVTWSLPSPDQGLPMSFPSPQIINNPKNQNLANSSTRATNWQAAVVKPADIRVTRYSFLTTTKSPDHHTRQWQETSWYDDLFFFIIYKRQWSQWSPR